VEIVSTTENDKSYVGNATIISHGLSPRSYPTGRPIIQTDLIEYNQGKLSGELIGTVIKTLEPQSYYSFNSRSGFQITGNNEDSFFNISVTGEISLTRLGSQSYMNNANELPNERTITVTTWSVDREHTTRKNITLRVLP
jgi:hypothetical protein